MRLPLLSSLLLLLLTYAPLTSSTDPDPTVRIRNSLSRYSLAIDSKAFTTLRNVFLPTASLNYSSTLGIFTSVTPFIHALETSLALVKTHHALSTQEIVLGDSEGVARSVT